MKLLNSDELLFEQNQNGFLQLKLSNGTIYESVECHPLFPLSDPEAYISISIQKDSNIEEIGIVRSLKELSVEQRALVAKEIQFRYFSPEILDIKKITSKYGVVQWEVMTDKGAKTFMVQDIKENIAIRDSGLIVITDIEKCRYQIRDYRKLPSKARIELEQTLL
jgi:hypothetical protein